MSKINENLMENAMRAMGFRDNLCGTEMLRIAIREYEPGMRMTKELYPMIASRVGSTPSRVERSMRHAIESAFDRGDPLIINGIFGYSLSPDKGKPTNWEFIGRMARECAVED